MRVVADENGWELVETPGMAISSMPPVSATVSSSAPGSGVFRKVDDATLGVDDDATRATDPAPASGDDADRSDEIRLPMPARLPPDLTGDKSRVA